MTMGGFIWVWSGPTKYQTDALESFKDRYKPLRFHNMVVYKCGNLLDSDDDDDGGDQKVSGSQIGW